MAGHSKWANIKHRKAAQDKERSKIFTKLIREISVAAKEGGDDEEANPRLRLAVQRAKKNNMPNDIINRAIKKALGGDSEDIYEVVYEGYAANGVAVIIECQTDNINRTVANIRSIFNKGGGHLGTSGSVSFLFDKKGVFRIAPGEYDPEELELELIDAGAEEIDHEEAGMIITTPFEMFGPLNDKLQELGIQPEEASIQQIPRTTVPLSVENAQKVLRLIDQLEDEDDVAKVFHNLEMTEELEQHLTSEVNS